MNWREVLSWTALASVVGEVVSAFFIEAPVAALVFAGLFLVGWWWLKRGGIAAVVLLFILSALEIAGLAFYEREDADDWILQALFAVLGLIGVVSAGVLLWQHFGRARTA